MGEGRADEGRRGTCASDNMAAHECGVGGEADREGKKIQLDTQSNTENRTLSKEAGTS